LDGEIMVMPFEDIPFTFL